MQFISKRLDVNSASYTGIQANRRQNAKLRRIETVCLVLHDMIVVHMRMMMLEL